MRALLVTAVSTFILGLAGAVIGAVTWPVWDARTEYNTAMIAAEYAGTDAPSPLEFALPPGDFYTGHILLLSVAGLLLGVGILAGLLTLHARAIREAL